MTDLENHQLLAKALELHRAGRAVDAGDCYARILKSDPNNVDAIYGLGTVKLQLNEADQAARLLEQAVRMEPESPEIVFNYALALDKVGNKEAAGSFLGRAAELAADDPQMRVRICRMLLRVGLAHVAYRHLSDIQPRSTELDALTYQAQAAAGDWPGAVENLRKLLDTGTTSAAAWREISTSAARVHDYATARRAFETYLSLKTPTAADHLAHADLLIMARELDLAEELLSTATGLDGPSAEFMRAKIARFRNQPEKCRDHLKKVIEARPSDAEAWGLLVETEPQEPLEEIAQRCSELSRGNDGTERERMSLALTAGRVFDRIGRYADAFECYRRGNEKQKEILRVSGKAYDPGSIERNFDGIMQRFVNSAARSAEIARDQPIFVVGMPRSGTTLVEKILSCFDGVRIGGEITALEFVAAQYYRSLGDRKTASPDELTIGQRQALTESYWQWAGREPGLITDKMPHNFRNIGLITLMFPSAPVIYMRRDPRDVCLSIYAREFPEGHSYACDLGWLAHFYAQSVRIMRYWQALYPDRILEIVYEDLVDDLEATTLKLAKFCRVDWNSSCLQFQRKQSTSFTFSEMQVRKPLNRAGIGRWRHYERELAPLSKLLTDNNLI
ncbi:MAG: sulfotransferase [Gammaproteobacteria bacterium]|nr:sulfotransferase [Gammaproteobacteria bacterium]